MEQESQSISENLWWVLPGKLAGVRKPTNDELTELQQAGIDAIISVMDDPSNLDLYQSANISYLWLPIKGGTVPSYEQLQELQNFIDGQKNVGKAVAIHCTSGRRRTGTVIASYLISTGYTYEDAINTIQKANPNVELSAAQSTFLRELAENR